jgi:hypothetical protein
MTRVKMSVEYVKQALCNYAREKAGSPDTCLCSVHINGMWSVIGDGPAVAVMVRPVPNDLGARES